MGAGDPVLPLSAKLRPAPRVPTAHRTRTPPPDDDGPHGLLQKIKPGGNRAADDMVTSDPCLRRFWWSEAIVHANT